MTISAMRIPPATCPACGEEHTTATGEGIPRGGDLTVCAACGAVLIFKQEVGRLTLVHDPDWRTGLDEDLVEQVELVSLRLRTAAAPREVPPGEGHAMATRIRTLLDEGSGLQEDTEHHLPEGRVVVFAGGAPCACGPGFCCSADANGGFGVCIGRRKNLSVFPPCPHCGAEHQGISAKDHPRFPQGSGRVVCWNCNEHPEPPYRLARAKAEAAEISLAMEAWARDVQGEES